MEPRRAERKIMDPVSAHVGEVSPGHGGSRLSSFRRHWRQAAAYSVLCVVTLYAASHLGGPALAALDEPWAVPAVALFGASVGLTKARRLIWWAAGLVVALLLLIGYTPLMDRPVRSLIRQDALQPSPAVVVLSSTSASNGSLTLPQQARVLRGLEIVRQGLAGELLLTRLPRPQPSTLPAVEGLMRNLRLELPVEETAEEVRNTHDEALAVARLARERHWGRVILVSDPTHMRRAAAAFETAGVPVLCAPCTSWSYVPTRLTSQDNRNDAFRDWVHESLSYVLYQRRGWIH